MILITGGSGFIGRHLAIYLSRLGFQIAGIGHGSWSSQQASSFGFDLWLDADISFSSLSSSFSNTTFTHIFHLAGGSSVGASLVNPREDFSRNVCSTFELLEWHRHHNMTASVILASSAAIYGSNYTNSIPESAASSPFSPYGYHKLMAENICESYRLSYGLDYRVVRLFSVYGSSLRKQLLWDICSQLNSRSHNITLGGTGFELRDWIHIVDVVRLMSSIAFLSVPSDFPRVFNVGTGSGTSVRDIASLVIDSWSHLTNTSKVPLSFSGKVRSGDPFSLVADIGSLKAIDSLKFTSVSDGIPEYLEWYLSASRRLQ